jgi:hypothetical protein
MDGRRPRLELPALGIAAGGVLAGHWLTYLIVRPDHHDRASLLATTGHGYLDAVFEVVWLVALVACAATFLTRLARTDVTPAFVSLAGRVSLFQIGAFVVLEVVERAIAGSFAGLLAVCLTGSVVQLLVAIAAAWLLRRLEQAAGTVASVLGRAARTTIGRAIAPLRLSAAFPHHGATYATASSPRRRGAASSRAKELIAMSRCRAVTATVLVFGPVMLGATSASAHEEVHLGRLELVVGFGEEPAYTGQPNSVQVILSRDGEPVSHVGGLEVEVSFGDASESFPLEESFDTPGDFRAPFIPSQPGDYTFHVTGRVEGERIDEEVTSGPSTFSSVKEASAAAFPPIEAPSNDELATRIETESARTASVERAAGVAQAAASDASSTAVIGVVVGAIGIIAAIGALVAARRR